jgi:prevent-host-death family protein
MRVENVEISVRQLKDRLSQYLRAAQAGEEVVVTSHGKPVARLLPPAPATEDAQADAVARLDGQPWIRAGDGGKVRGSERPAPWPEAEKSLSEIILEDRE